jgi:hypothetical protein
MYKVQFKEIEIGGTFYFEEELYLKVGVNTGTNGEKLRYFKPTEKVDKH